MKALLFDLDGVLVDVAASYRRAVDMTVRHFSGTGIDPRGIQSYKDRGGLNNDWDLTLAVLADRGVPAGRDSVIEIFQGFYLGKDFDGLIGDEKWLLDPATLTPLSGEFRAGIVTGRPRPETRYTLGLFDALSLFPVVVTMDDLPPGRGKPDPLGIRLALSLLGMKEGFYAGDTVDDMAAARAAGLVPIGVALPAEGKDGQEARLLDAGAARVIADINRIGEVLT
ncbi:MAG: HAD-IA family hydrolase [Candidatus Aminicenantales bacterium]